MQYPNREYNPENHDTFKALSVKQPYARLISEGVKTVELRSKNISYRGKLMICATSDKMGDLPVGCTICIVELYDVKRLKDLTDDEIVQTCVNKENEYWKKAKYAWMIRNVEPYIEFPVKGQVGVWNLVYTKDILLPKVKSLPATDED